MMRSSSSHRLQTNDRSHKADPIPAEGLALSVVLALLLWAGIVALVWAVF